MDNRRVRDELLKRGGYRDAISDRYKQLAPDSIEILWQDFVEETRGADASIDYIAAIQDELDVLDEYERRAGSFVSKVSRWQTTIMPELIKEFAFAIPTSDALSYLVDHSPIIEMGAFNGYWAYEIERRGGEIIAYDIDPVDDPWFPITDGDQNVLLSHDAGETLLLCWPPAGGMAYESILLHDGDVIYIGELPGEGFKAFGDMRFFDVLAAQYEEITSIPLPNHPGAKDRLYHYRPNQ